jgi:hypothetical protein
MAERACEQCGGPMDGRGPRATTCSDTCRSRKSKGYPPVTVLPTEAPAPRGGAVEQATSAALADVDRLETPLGQMCVVLARRMDGGAFDTGSAIAAVAKQLEALLLSATRGTAAATAPQQLRDELAERRRKHGA